MSQWIDRSLSLFDFCHCSSTIVPMWQIISTVPRSTLHEKFKIAGWFDSRNKRSGHHGHQSLRDWFISLYSKGRSVVETKLTRRHRSFGNHFAGSEHFRGGTRHRTGRRTGFGGIDIPSLLMFVAIVWYSNATKEELNQMPMSKSKKRKGSAGSASLKEEQDSSSFASSSISYPSDPGGPRKMSLRFGGCIHEEHKQVRTWNFLKFVTYLHKN